MRGTVYGVHLLDTYGVGQFFLIGFFGLVLYIKIITFHLNVLFIYIYRYNKLFLTAGYNIGLFNLYIILYIYISYI